MLVVLVGVLVLVLVVDESERPLFGFMVLLVLTKHGAVWRAEMAHPTSYPTPRRVQLSAVAVVDDAGRRRPPEGDPWLLAADAVSGCDWVMVRTPGSAESEAHGWR